LICSDCKDQEENDGGISRNKKRSLKCLPRGLKTPPRESSHLQDWVKAKGLRIIVVFEGRDGAGKGGTIRAITERVSPRVFRVVALPAPSNREKSQMYMRRYVEHFPAAGRS
jgi:polyphosphate kinase 2 (PPK2 family)